MNSFQDLHLPKGTRLAGLSYILNKLVILAPLKNFHAISEKIVKNNTQVEKEWTIYSSSYWPGETLFSHLTFSLKYETLNLLALKKIFEKIKPEELEPHIAKSPSSIYSRKIWFLYEWLTQKTLKLENLEGITYIKLLDEDDYFTIKGKNHPRQRINNNMISVKNFGFIISKTEKIKSFVEENLKEKTNTIINTTDKRLISRAASFLLLADTKATYEIEGEWAPQNRLERWAKVILEAGKNPLTLEEVERLHKILLKDDRFVKNGLRDTEVFLGDRDYDQKPRPEFIGAKKKDLPELVQSWLELNQQLKESQLDPIIQATIIAFSFVYIHPLQDGNGRLHRYLFHHVLADRDFTPKGIIFPVSSVIFDWISKYKETLTSVSSPLLEYINWESDDKLNVKILNETIELYQYFDFTKNSEFFYEVVKHTVEIDLPQQLEQLKKYDNAHRKLIDYIEMPENQLSLLITVIRDNDFILSSTKKKKFFNALGDQEVADIEAIVREAYIGQSY